MKRISELDNSDVGKKVYILFINTFPHFVVYEGVVHNTGTTSYCGGYLKFPIKHFIKEGSNKYEWIGYYTNELPKDEKIKLNVYIREDECEWVFSPQCGIIYICYNKDEILDCIKKYYDEKIKEKYNDINKIIELRDNINIDEIIEYSI